MKTPVDWCANWVPSHDPDRGYWLLTTKSGAACLVGAPSAFAMRLEAHVILRGGRQYP